MGIRFVLVDRRDAWERTIYVPRHKLCRAEIRRQARRVMAEELRKGTSGRVDMVGPSGAFIRSVPTG